MSDKYLIKLTKYKTEIATIPKENDTEHTMDWITSCVAIGCPHVNENM